LARLIDEVIGTAGQLAEKNKVRILRKNGFKAPIIMLTGHNTDSDTILGLESGANDYVTKPFRFAVMLARNCASTRRARTPSSPSAPIRFGRAPRCCLILTAVRCGSRGRRPRSCDISIARANVRYRVRLSLLKIAIWRD
jgi:hypothetical protein